MTTTTWAPAVLAAPTVKAEVTDGRFKCPTCGKSVAVTETGKAWAHDKVQPPKSKAKPVPCPISGAFVVAGLSGEYMVQVAEYVGRAAHKNDKDKTGNPYHEHLQGVHDGVVVLAGPTAYFARATAWLHDTVEDHPGLVSLEKLRLWGFPEEVVLPVEAISKKSGEEQGVYLARIIAAGVVCQLAKLSDLMNNTRRDRLAALKDDYTRVRLLKKYRPSIAALQMELGIIATQEDQDKLKAVSTVPVGTATGGTYAGGALADGSQYFSASSLIIGDWPAGWAGPIKSKLTKHKDRYILETADGDVPVKAKNVSHRTWTKTEWQSRQKKDETWSPANEEQLPRADVVKLIAAEKEANAPKSICGECGLATISRTPNSWVHQSPASPYHAVRKPTDEQIDAKATGKPFVPLEKKVTHVVTKGSTWPSTSVKKEVEERSFCGSCGEVTERLEGAKVFYHKVTPNYQSVGGYHSPSRPTPVRIERLGSKGLLPKDWKAKLGTTLKAEWEAHEAFQKEIASPPGHSLNLVGKNHDDPKASKQWRCSCSDVTKFSTDVMAAWEQHLAEQSTKALAEADAAK